MISIAWLPEYRQMRKCKEKDNMNTDPEITYYIQTPLRWRYLPKTQNLHKQLLPLPTFFFPPHLFCFFFWNGDERKLKINKRKSRQEFASAGLKSLIADGSTSRKLNSTDQCLLPFKSKCHIKTLICLIAHCYIQKRKTSKATEMKSSKAKKEKNLNLLSKFQWVTVTCLFLNPSRRGRGQGVQPQVPAPPWGNRHSSRSTPTEL